MKQHKLTAGSGFHNVVASITHSGDDLIVCICGGEKEHVGAVALAIPRPSLADPKKISASTSVLCLTGHKEDEIARDGALQLASHLNCTVVLTVGLHVDFAKPEDISILESNYSAIIEEIKKQNYC